MASIPRVKPFSGLKAPAIVVDALHHPESAAIWFYPETAVFHNLLGWALAGILWYPATHAARKLLSEVEMPGTWYVFWLLPAMFIVVNLFFKPLDYTTLYAGRMVTIYPVTTVFLLATHVVLLLYVLSHGPGIRG